MKYGKLDLGIWGAKVHNQGTLFDRIEFCNYEDAEIQSDCVYLKEGVKWILACGEWEKLS